MNTTKVKTASCRVVAPSSREALRLVREKLGPDAIVLSNKVTAEGVEIVAVLEQAITAMMESTPSLTLTPTLTSTSTPVMAPHPQLQVVPVRESAVAAPAADNGDAVLREIHSMRGMIEDQLAGIVWNEAQRRDPVRGHLLRTLLGTGFSARLAKDLLTDLPTGQSYADGLAYVKSAIESRLPML